MKKQLIILGTMVLVLSLVVVRGGSESQAQNPEPSYTYVQEQGATGSFDSPVIHHTAEQVESAILG